MLLNYKIVFSLNTCGVTIIWWPVKSGKKKEKEKKIG